MEVGRRDAAFQIVLNGNGSGKCQGNAARELVREPFVKVGVLHKVHSVFVAILSDSDDVPNLALHGLVLEVLRFIGDRHYLEETESLKQNQQKNESDD